MAELVKRPGTVPAGRPGEHCMKTTKDTDSEQLGKPASQCILAQYTIIPRESLPVLEPDLVVVPIAGGDEAALGQERAPHRFERLKDVAPLAVMVGHAVPAENDDRPHDD